MKNQLKEDLNDFLKEKEELREVIGKIGGNNNSQAKIVTTLFVGIVLVIFVAGIVLKQLSPMTTLLLLILILGFQNNLDATTNSKINAFSILDIKFY